MPEAHPLVMITGASSGIGKALAFTFAAEDNPLLLISRHIEPPSRETIVMALS